MRSRPRMLLLFNGVQIASSHAIDHRVNCVFLMSYQYTTTFVLT